MSAAADDMRRWTQIARVRSLRIVQLRVALAEVQRDSQAARAEVAAREAMREHHAAQLPRLLAHCAHGFSDSRLWREALAGHQARAAELDAAVQAASATLVIALAELRRASSALHRAMHAHDDAHTRLHAITRELRKES